MFLTRARVPKISNYRELFDQKLTSEPAWNDCHTAKGAFESEWDNIRFCKENMGAEWSENDTFGGWRMLQHQC